MKIGVLIQLDEMHELDEKIARLVEENFDNCQLLIWNTELFTEENAIIIRDKFKENNVTISVFWCGWAGPQKWDPYDGPLTLGLVPPEYREMRVKNLCDGADFAKILGVDKVATHMGFIPENPNDPQFIPLCDAVREVSNHLKKNGQYLLFETGQETPATMLRCMEVVGTDNLGVNYDTANLILYGKANPVDGLDTIGNRVMNVHAKDGFYPTTGREEGTEMPIGQGKVDFETVISRLYNEFHYDGYITIEREITGDQQVKDIREGRIYLQKILDKVCK